MYETFRQQGLIRELCRIVMYIMRLVSEYASSR